MTDIYYGLLAVTSLTGVVISMFGPIGSIVGLSMIALSNGITISMACKQKCQRAPPPVES